MLPSLLLFVAVFQGFLGRFASFWPPRLIGNFALFWAFLANF
jgi:hypothetical protein